MRSARRDLWLCSPSTQEMASTTFDFPQPFGPTIHVVPEPLKVTTVRSQNDLKPTISTFRSLSKVSPFFSHLAFSLACHRAHPILNPASDWEWLVASDAVPSPFLFIAAQHCCALPRQSNSRKSARNERRLCIPRGEGLLSVRSAPHTGTARKASRVNGPLENVGRFLFRAQPPGARMAVREKTLTRCFYRVKAYAIDCGAWGNGTI